MKPLPHLEKKLSTDLDERSNNSALSQKTPVA